MHPSPETLPTFELWALNSATGIVAAVLILITGWIAAGWAARWTSRGLGRLHHFDETLKPLVASLVRYAILIATFIAVLQRFGVETTSFIAVVGAAGVAVGLALQGTLSNVAAGVMLLVLRPFRVGDGIQAAGQSGTVREIGLFTTILVNDDLAYVSIPNAAIFGGVIVNNSREPNRRINFIVSIDFSNEIDTAQKIVLDVLRSDPRVLESPPPMTGVGALREYAIDIVVRCWVRNADNEAVMFSVQKAIKDRFHAAGIAIPARRQTATARAEPEPATTRPAAQKAH
ncbi:MAG TPA: mechanosensitive ion channel domain-containing protein [Rhizomicrobium sp.]|jgi:small conductance mechanosensitive channel|nr:mechanosensitive ion channel domain-containing protein [Rhizomicrobium sp.]